MRRPEQFLAALAAFAVVQTAWGFHGLPECGEAEAPQCDGECPSGTRCTQVEFSQLSLVRLIQLNSSEPEPGTDPEQPGCACLEVPCGGVPLEDGQACCKGEVINAGDPCDCLPMGNAPVDTSDSGLFACCYRETEFQGNSSLVDKQWAVYTYNLPLDCCEGTTCGGTCHGAECAAEDCCACEPYPSDDFPTPACAGGDSDIGCLAGCFFSPDGVGLFPLPEFGIGNHSGVRIEGGTCGGEGCIPPAAPAPAASSTGLGVSVACLLAIGALAFVRRRRSER